MKADSGAEASYSIAAVSKLSGVSCHTLRVWERRYGFPVPQRLASGHRRYPPEQVSLICRVARRCRAGGPIAQHIAEARAGRLADEADAGPDPAAPSPIAQLLTPLLEADAGAAEATYERLTAGLGPAEIATRILGPGLTESGERLFRRHCTLAEERLASMFLLRKLAALVDAAARANAAPVGRVVVFVMQGDRHEGGALMLSLGLELAGWRALYLGADLPIDRVQNAIDAWRPDAVGVSLSLSRNIRKRFDELARLRGAPIFVGGRSILNYQGLARRSGLGIFLGPAIPGIGPYLDDFLRSASREAAGDERDPGSGRAGHFLTSH